MSKKYQSILAILLMLVGIFFIFFLFNASKAEDTATSINANSLINTSDKELSQIIKKQQASGKPLEEITLMDIVKDEKISPELRRRIINLLDQVQYETDKYRTVIANHYRQVETKIVDFKNEMANLHTFKDTMEANLNIAKWMIISLSVGIVCLTVIIIVMWKSVVNVNRNDVEVIFTIEKFKKELNNIQKRMDIIEILIKKDEQQISNN